VCAIVDSKFSTVQIDTDPSIELVAFDMLLPNTRLRYIVVYRKPEYTPAARLYMESPLVCLRQLCSVDYTVLIAGDLNLPFVDGSLMDAIKESDEIHNNFIEFVKEFGF